MKRPEKEESLRWFTPAKDEFLDADDLRKRGRYYLALFHFQQAAEKAVKAFLYLRVKSFELFYIHSLSDLLEMSVEIDSDFKKVMRAKKLDKYYIPTRYPNGLPEGFLQGISTIQRKPKKPWSLRSQLSTLLNPR